MCLAHVCISVSLFLFISFVDVHVCLCLFVVCLALFLSVCLFLSISLSLCRPCVSMLSICLCVCPFCLSFHLCVCLSFHLSFLVCSKPPELAADGPLAQSFRAVRNDDVALLSQHYSDAMTGARAGGADRTLLHEVGPRLTEGHLRNALVPWQWCGGC